VSRSIVSRLGRPPWIRLDPGVLTWSVSPATIAVLWDSGSDEPWEVWVAEGQQESLVAVGAQGRASADWIQLGITYEFRLYRPGRIGPHAVAVRMRMTPAAKRILPGRRGRPFIEARPNPTPRQRLRGATTIAWDTGDGSVGEVKLVTYSSTGREDTLVARAPSGTSHIDWVFRDHRYRFDLYRADRERRPVASVTITMAGEREAIIADVAVAAIVLGVPIALTAMISMLVLAPVWSIIRAATRPS
jgi:hypothetical protein